MVPGAGSSLAVSVPSFATRKSYATGKIPVSVAIADLNGDGKPDVAVANEGAESESVSVLLNRGDGRLQPRRDYATGLEPSSVVIGDLNGDGKLDLATANEDNHTVSVLLNRGDGSFRAKRDYPAGFVVSLAIGDLNGDGKPDLAGADWSSGSVSVFINKGDGSLQPKHTYRTGTETESVAIGDLNDDGKPDLAAANRYAGRPTVSVLLNRGDGSFSAKHDYAGADPVWVNDRRPERRWPAGAGGRELRIAQRLGVCEQRRRHLPQEARLRNRKRHTVGRDRRLERRRKARPSDHRPRGEHGFGTGQQGCWLRPTACIRNGKRTCTARDRRPERRRPGGLSDGRLPRPLYSVGAG